MSGLLEEIQEINDIKKIEPEHYKELANEIRTLLLHKVSKTGGHLASNLGAVELTMALHLSLDFPEDKLVWDVGHQAYTHKILTGRKDQFDTLRKYHGMSGFPKTSESDCDAFDTGHSSTSISVALGLARGRDLQGRKNKVFAVIGDGALSGGMAFEALNNAANLKSNMVIILNDNKMSISENVGGMSNYLGKIRTNDKYISLKDGVEKALDRMPKVGPSIAEKIRSSKDSLKRLFIPGMLFEDMGLTYIGPVNGHNISEMMTAFKSAVKLDEPVIVHVKTKKGKGYRLAEKNPSAFHGVDPFYVKTGKAKVESNEVSYTDVFSEALIELARENEKIVAVCAAMPNGTGLSQFQQHYPERFFDVGIAEEHAVTFSAGLAAEGLKPVVAIYSTFLQRAYDQILHDVCIGGYPVVFAIDRSGIVGKDGETHQGIYDLSFLSSIPNMTIIAPKNNTEFIEMLNYCFDFNGPIAIRYPRGAAYLGCSETMSPIEYGKAEVIQKEKDILILAVGSMVKTAVKVTEKLKEQGRHVSLVNIRFVKPFDTDLISDLCKTHSIIVTMEENIKTGGFGQQVGSYLQENEFNQSKFINISLPDCFIEHGKVDILKEKYGLHEDCILEKINAAIDK